MRALRSDAGLVYGEVILAIAVVGTALAALTASMSAGFGHMRLAGQLAVAERLHADALQLVLGETLEATRARDGAVYQPPLLARGTPEPAYAGYAQRITARWATNPQNPAATQASPATDHLTVTVEVVGPGGPLGARTVVRSRR